MTKEQFAKLMLAGIFAIAIAFAATVAYESTKEHEREKEEARQAIEDMERAFREAGIPAPDSD